jgi:hypothetical protein
MTTYTKRTNAKRAGIKAGIPADQVEITVHKSDGAVRFGFKAKDAKPVKKAKPVIPDILNPEAVREVRNGVKRPAAGGLCDAVWQWLDTHPDAAVKDARAAAAKKGWNENNVVCEFYAHRKFNKSEARAS